MKTLERCELCRLQMGQLAESVIEYAYSIRAHTDYNGPNIERQITCIRQSLLELKKDLEKFKATRSMDA